jgi:hypothetical protein
MSDHKCEKMARWFSLILILALAVLPFALNVPVVRADTQVGGPIISSTTWTLANSPYVVIASIDVQSGVILTIEPGVTVKFNAGTKMQVNGGLVVSGTEASPITFTSSSTIPASDDWGNIEFTATAITTTIGTGGAYLGGSLLRHCVVEWAGRNTDSAIYAKSILIDSCTVRNNAARGIYLSGTQASPGRIEHSKITGNSLNNGESGGGVYIEYSVMSNSTVSNNDTVANFNPGGGVYASHSIIVSNTVRNNTLTSSQSGYGGGIYAIESEILSNTVSGNQVTGSSFLGESRGGGIDIAAGTVYGNIVMNNTARCAGDNACTGFGGGIAVDKDASAVIKDNIVVGNAAFSNWEAFGGGIAIAPNSGSNVVVTQNTIINNMAKAYSQYVNGSARGGGIYVYAKTGRVLIEKNTIAGNSSDADGPASGGGVHAYSDTYDPTTTFVTVTENLISDNWLTGLSAYGGGLYAECRDSTSGSNNLAITKNLIMGNSIEGLNIKGGVGVYVYTGGAFLYNSVINNFDNSPTAGAVEINSTPQVHFNSLYGNTPYDVAVVSSLDVSGTNNYFGTVSNVNILAQIYDWYDVSSRGKFLYLPYLQDPDLSAPILPPTGLRSDPHGVSIALTWIAHSSFTTGWGYKIYYDSDSPYPPYQGLGLSQGNSAIDVGNLTQITLTGLAPDKDYYFTVTAYDNQGHESWYSNYVSDRYMVYLPLVMK